MNARRATGRATLAKPPAARGSLRGRSAPVPPLLESRGSGFLAKGRKSGGAGGSPPHARSASVTRVRSPLPARAAAPAPRPGMRAMQRRDPARRSSFVPRREGERRGRGMRSVSRAQRRTKARHAAPPAGRWEEAAERAQARSGGVQASAAPVPRGCRAQVGAGRAGHPRRRQRGEQWQLAGRTPQTHLAVGLGRRGVAGGVLGHHVPLGGLGAVAAHGGAAAGERGTAAEAEGRRRRSGQGKTERSPGRLKGRYAVRPPQEAPRSGRRWLGWIPRSAVAVSAQLPARACLALSLVRKSGG